MTAKVSDIRALRNGKINEAKFRSRLVFGEPKTDESLAKKIQIMAGILDQTIGTQRRHLGPFRETSPTGVYLEGAGALFFAKPSREVDVYFFSSGETKKEDDGAKKLKDDLVEVIADYGHTLRSMKPTEHIAIQVDPIREAFWKEGKKSGLLIKVQKKDIDAYNKGKVGLGVLKKRIQVDEILENPGQATKDHWLWSSPTLTSPWHQPLKPVRRL